MLVVLAGTAIVGGIVAEYVWGILPQLKEAFGQQTDISNIDASSIIHVQATESHNLWMLAAGIVTGLVVRSLMASGKSAPIQEL